jgi:hypothetical protein
MSQLLVGDLTGFEALCAAAADDRPHPAADQLEQLGLALMTETLEVLAGTALEEVAPMLAEGLIGGLHSTVLRLQRDFDRAADAVGHLAEAFDGSEVEDVRLQEATSKAHAAEAAICAVELIRDQASATYTAQTGEHWTPWKGGVKRTASTAALIDARQALRSKQARAHAAVDPGACVVAFRGSPRADTQIDAGRIYDALNWALGQWPRMKLATTGAPGAERLAGCWARDHHVDLIVAKPDFERFAKAAPFRANDTLMALEPVVLLTLAKSLDADGRQTNSFGPALNAAERAEHIGVRHLSLRLRRS